MNNIDSYIELINKNLDTFTFSDFPAIELYMDQVTTLVNDKCGAPLLKDEDKSITKTMINNYCKSKILPAPNKKKYSKDHLIVLSLINFFKNTLSISDTHTLIQEAVDTHFHNEELPLADIVDQMINCVQNMSGNEDILELHKKCTEEFLFSQYENPKYLQTLTFVTLLSYQAYVRQQLIVKLINNLNDSNPEEE